MSLNDYLNEFALGDLAATTNVPGQTGLSRQKVSDLQNILIKLGWKATTIPRPGAKDFGLYGPKTASAWGQSAGTRKLNPTFQRASATEAFVDPTTLASLSGGAAQAAPAAAARPAAAAPATKAAPKAAPKATQPTSTAMLVNFGAKSAYDLLYGIGWTTKKLPKAAVYTPTLAKAWGISATTRKLNPVMQPTAYADSVLVDPTTLASIQTEVKKKAVMPGAPAKEKAAQQTPVAKEVAGTLVRSVAELQKLLYGVGWTAKKLSQDGKYGPQTKKAWGVSAKLRKLPEMFDRVDGANARVSQSTYDKIVADAAMGPVAPAPAPIPAPGDPGGGGAPVAPPTAADMIDKSVADIQNLLIKLGWKASTIPRKGAKDFGLYGPKTKGAWESSTGTRKLDPTFVRVDSKTARINARSYVAMLEETMGKKPYQPPAPPTPGPQLDLPKPPEPGSVATITVAEMQDIVHRLGEPKTKATTDKKFGPSTQKAWEAAASKFSTKTLMLNPGITAKKGAAKASVDATTYAVLKANATKAPAPAPSVLDADTLMVDTVQTGLNALAKSKLTVDGSWGSKTEKALRRTSKTR